MPEKLAPFESIAVLGAGAWGTALALAALAAGRKTSLWVREDEVLESIRRTSENPFLPGVILPKDLDDPHPSQRPLPGPWPGSRAVW